MDINSLMKQAQAMQKQLEETTRKLNAMQFEGSASNGMVKVVVNGEYRVVSVNIDEEIINKEDKEMLEEMIMIAFNDASQKIDQSKKDGLGSMADMLGM
ncbi:MAG: YbaB/EbfC family nucleoid-associated protein [Erysipelotrichaceae bacterium]|nr:YbaB/EbfC family nucleoid-associated protein [Erysipelotrichaceae bacterium]